ncbi:hypothetical protein ANN_19744 [Periplaneta americana]|uniref:Uncharacterized protein n=1 Tax=Periplaneta americana TaxID=6978 RepID=A0ABQ8SBA6_PERAM|nr:hypothetical protein ANN_19744 [Periplaneta americana]
MYVICRGSLNSSLLALRKPRGVTYCRSEGTENSLSAQCGKEFTYSPTFKFLIQRSLELRNPHKKNIQLDLFRAVMNQVLIPSIRRYGWAYLVSFFLLDTIP